MLYDCGKIRNKAQRNPIAGKLIKIGLRGSKVRCNICGNNYRHFMRDNLTRNKNVRCPNCGSLTSDRVLWFYLKNEVLGKKNKNNFLSFDSDTTITLKIQQSGANIHIEKPDYFNQIENPDFEKLAGGKYDVIIFAHLLQKIKDEQATFAELKRLLRTGGFILIMTIINWEMDRTYEKPETDEDKDRLRNYYTPGVERVYGADIAKRLAKAGFAVETIDFADQLGSAAREYYCLGEGTREIIFKCKKIKSNNGSN